MRLSTVCAQLLGQLPVAVAERGHQVGAVLHLDLAGAGAQRHPPCVGRQPLAAHGGPGQEAAADHVPGLLHLDGDLLGLRLLLLQGQARQPHGWGWGTVTRLWEDRAVGWHPLELGLGGSTYKQQRSSLSAQGEAWEQDVLHSQRAGQGLD